MHAFHQYLSKQLAEHLKKRRVVVWYDLRREFAPYVRELLGGQAPAGCRVETVSLDGQETHFCQYDGSFFEVRAAVEPLVAIEAPEPLLIYLPGVERDRKGSVLMELEKAGTCYEPQLKRLARNVLRQRYTDGVIDEVLAPEGVGYEEIVRLLEQGESGERASLLRVILLEARDNRSLLAAWLARPAVDEAIREKGATGELYKLVHSCLGLELDDALALDEARSKALRYALVGELRADLGCEPPAVVQMIPRPGTQEQLQSVREVAETLRRQHADIYVELADRVESELGLAGAPIPPPALGCIDTFRFEERALLGLAADLIAQGDYSGALKLISERQRSFWVDRSLERQSQWVACRLMAELGALVEEIRPRLGKMESSPLAWVEAYSGEEGWCRADLAQRNLDTWVARMEGEPEAEQALERVHQAYEELLQEMALGFTGAFARAGWTIPRALHQTRIYPELVEGRGTPVAYFLVDAMRYEMGLELRDQLKDAQDLLLKPAVAALPTLTPVGMAALLPGASASFNVIEEKERLAACINGSPLRDLQGRMKFLKARVPGAVEMELGRLLQMPTRKLKAAIEGAPLIVVRSQEIDALGEIGNNQLARQLMDTAVGNVARAVRKLAGLGVERFVISADHGYQFTREKEEAFHTDPPGGETLAVHRRCWIGRGGKTPQGALRVNGAELGYDTPLDFIFPTGIGVFKAGGSLAYHHGGISLQELIVPALSLRIPSAGSAPAQRGEVKLSGVPQALTNRTFGITLELGGLFGHQPLVVRPILLGEGAQVGEAGMAIEAEFDPSTRCVTLQPKRPAGVAMVLQREDCPKLRVVIQDPATDGVLAQSEEIPVKLGI